MSNFLKMFFLILFVLLMFQFLPFHSKNEKFPQEDDFTKVENTPPLIEKLMRKACYDCHSFQTNYHNYTRIAPLGWPIYHHVEKGRRYLNYSQWAEYNLYQKRHALQKSITTLQDHSMPLRGYVAQHPEARLSEEERTALEEYFKALLDELPTTPMP